MKKNVFFGCFFLLVGLFGCGKNLRRASIPIGTTVTLMPMSEARLEGAQEGKPKHFLVTFDLGGKLLAESDEVVIEMYAQNGDTVPLYSYTAAELHRTHAATSCPDRVLRMMDKTHSGEAAFCNGMVDLQKISHFVAVIKGKKNKVATSKIHEFTEGELWAFSLAFH